MIEDIRAKCEIKNPQNLVEMLRRFGLAVPVGYVSTSGLPLIFRQYYNRIYKSVKHYTITALIGWR